MFIYAYSPRNFIIVQAQVGVKVFPDGIFTRRMYPHKTRAAQLRLCIKMLSGEIVRFQAMLGR
jgi:hypothetical protein